MKKTGSTNSMIALRAQVRAVLRDWPTKNASPDLADRVMAAIRADGQPEKSGLRVKGATEGPSTKLTNSPQDGSV